MEKTSRHKFLGMFLILIMISLAFLGGTEALASSTSVTIGKDAVRETIYDYIDKNMPLPGGSFRVEFFDELQNVKLAGSGIMCRVIPGRTVRTLGTITLNVGFYQKGRCVLEKPVRVRVEACVKKVCSAGYLPRGIIIGPEDVTVVERWCARIPSRRIIGLKDIVGKRLLTSVKPQKEITGNMLREPVLVKRGKVVRIVIEKGPMKMVTLGLSQQNGAKGEIIRVKNMTSKKEIYAQVMDGSQVRVDF